MRDLHVHTHHSWDTSNENTMATMAAAASQAGLSLVAFSDHVDLVSPGRDQHAGRTITVNRAGGSPDAAQYFAEIEQTRSQFPDLTLLASMEIGEPHYFQPQLEDHRSQHHYDLVLGSVHCLPTGGELTYIEDIIKEVPLTEVLPRYFAEIEHLLSSNAHIDVLTHLNFPFRFVPAAGMPEPSDYEDDYRRIFRALATNAVALELNSRTPALTRTQLEWFIEEGGQFIALGSDAHHPDAVGQGIAAAASDMIALGFRWSSERQGLMVHEPHPVPRTHPNPQTMPYRTHQETSSARI